MKIKLLISFFLSAQILSAQNFEYDENAPFLGLLYSDVAFSDIDGDGDQDVLTTGQWSILSSIAPYAILYINDGEGNYTSTPNNFTGIESGDIAFCDIDNDGDEDVFLTGGYGSNSGTSLLYMNDGTGNFTVVTETPFIGLRNSSVAFADVDNDSDQDLLLSGYDTPSNIITKLYTNNGMGIFTEMTQVQFEGVDYSSMEFTDVDGDNDQDVLITGSTISNEYISKLYINDGSGNFTEIIGTPFEGVFFGSLAFSDVDGDNDQDVVITGINESDISISKLYTNDGNGNFTEMEDTPFFGAGKSSIAFSDVDSDNDQDLIISGGATKLYMNNGAGEFVLSTESFVNVDEGSLAFADIDGDNDEDLLITGYSGAIEGAGKLYFNESVVANVDEENSRLGFIIYPNPTTTSLNILVTPKSDNKTSLMLYDLSGRLLRQQQIYGYGEKNITMHISSLDRGSYIVKIEENGRNESQLVVIN